MDRDSVLLDAEERMEKALSSLEREFGKLRTGRASTSLVDGIKVDYYGTPTPIGQLASVATPDSRTITIQPWDRGAFSGVEKAILKSDLGLTPINDGKIIRISIPPLTEDRRKELVKVARKYGEEAKVAVRNIRRDGNDQLKKLEKDKTISEDDLKKATDEMQKLTDRYVARVDERGQGKEKEIMELQAQTSLSRLLQGRFCVGRRCKANIGCMFRTASATVCPCRPENPAFAHGVVTRNEICPRESFRMVSPACKTIPACSCADYPAGSFVESGTDAERIRLETFQKSFHDES